MADDVTCFHCGAPATLLCDYILGFEWMGSAFKRGSLESPVQHWYRVSTDESRMFTCDRPLCEACATNKGAAFYCGSGGCEIVTHDYCCEHAAAGGREGKNIISEAEAEVLRGRVPAGLAVIG